MRTRRHLCTYLVNFGELVAGFFLPATVIVTLAFSCSAHALPRFTSSVSVYDQDSGQNLIFGPVDGVLTHSFETTGQHISYEYQPPVYLDYSSQIIISTGYGPGISPTGPVDVGRMSLSATAEGYQAIAQGTGQIDFYFTAEPTGSPPSTPVGIPIKIFPIVNVELTAQATEWPDTAQVTAAATLRIENSPSAPSIVVSRDTPGSTPWHAFLPALLPVGATAHVMLDVGTYIRTENGYMATSATIDPIVEFDQATFDSAMGSSTFLLADYYRFDVSPNVPAIPEPPAMLLIGPGLLGLARLRKQLRRQIRAH